MESKNDDALPSRDTKDEPAPPLAPTLKIVAKQFLARRAALGEAALDCDGIECLYGDFVEDNADEFEGFDPSDGSGNDHALKALHEEFLELFHAGRRGRPRVVGPNARGLRRDVEEARRDGLEERWDALEGGDGRLVLRGVLGGAERQFAEGARLLKATATSHGQEARLPIGAARRQVTMWRTAHFDKVSRHAI